MVAGLQDGARKAKDGLFGAHVHEHLVPPTTTLPHDGDQSVLRGEIASAL